MVLRLIFLFGLLASSIVATYFTNDTLSSFFHFAVFAAYLRSRDEALWLTYFFVVSDGFLGFFNNYEAVISIIPGLPDIEVGQLYVLGSILKVTTRKVPTQRLFHDGVLAVLGIYVIFLVIQGYVIGVESELRAHFRILKFLLPLALFYTIPRLMDDVRQYRDTFHLFIPFALLALFAQVFTVATGFAPSQALGVRQDLWFTDVLERGHTYRGFYSTGMVLISFFGALYYSTAEPQARERPLYLAVMLANILSAFLSATRGWVLAFAMVMVLHALLVVRLKAQRIIISTIVGFLVLFGMLQIPPVAKQFQGASDRILTIGLLAKGDVTAGGTLERLDRRAPRVINKWADSRLTGWGFSQEFSDYSDSHVGNHNVLLHAGIIGAALMAFFLGFITWSMVARQQSLPGNDLQGRALLVFPVFLLGWFIIHSSSGQQFMFYGEPGTTIPQALFFSFSASCYQRSFNTPA